jgi:hypothetical protein
MAQSSDASPSEHREQREERHQAADGGRVLAERERVQ